MRSRFGRRRPTSLRRPTTLAAAWVVAAAFLAALAAQAFAQAAHDHAALSAVPAVCCHGESDPHTTPHATPHATPHGDRHDRPAHPCPVCEKSSLAKAGLAPPPPARTLDIPRVPNATPTWARTQDPGSRGVHTPRARGPPRAA